MGIRQDEYVNISMKHIIFKGKSLPDAGEGMNAMEIHYLDNKKIHISSGPQGEQKKSEIFEMLE